MFGVRGLSRLLFEWSPQVANRSFHAAAPQRDEADKSARQVVNIFSETLRAKRVVFFARARARSSTLMH
jgi:hypothetical protein